MRETKMSKFSLFLQTVCLINNFQKKSSDQMETFTSERCNTHTLCHSLTSFGCFVHNSKYSISLPFM